MTHFCDSEPGRIDGVSTSAGRSVALLRAAGHDVAHHHPGPLRGGGPPGAIRSVAVPFRQVRVASPWARVVPDAAPDVVHVHTTGPVGMAGFRLAAARCVPLVLTWHTDLLAYADHFAEIPIGAAYCARRLGLGWTLRDHLELTGAGGRRHARLLRLGRAMMARASLVIAPSAKTAAGLAVFGPLPPVRVVPTPVVPPDRPLAAGPGPPVVLSVGRGTPEKNPALLLRAFAAVRAARADARLVVVGVDRDRRPVRALIRELGLTGSVRLVPPVPRAEVAAFYRAAGVLAFASTTDTQSLVVAEAEAAGLPVVLADPGLAERPGAPSRRCTCAATPDALAAALLRMLDDPVLRERTRRAGLAAAAGYPPARHLALLTAAYDEAIRRGPAAGSGDEIPDQHDGQEDHDERQVDADPAEP